MKKLLLGFALLFALCIFFTSCSTDQVHDTSTNNEILLRTSELNYDLRLPDNTQFTVTDESINFTLPDGYFLIGNDIDNNARHDGGGKLTCTCESVNSTGKCTATETDKTVGCNTEKSNPCPECKGKVTTSASYELVDYYILTPSDRSSNYALFASTRAAVDLDEWNNSPWLDMSQIDESEIQEIVNYAWEDADESEGVVAVLMISEGGKFTVDIPYSSLEPGNIYTSTGKTSCSGCDGTCVLKKAAFGKVRYCDGCASGCTISW